MNWESRCWPTVNGMTGSFEHCSDGSHNGSSIKPPVDWQFHGDYTIPKKCFFWYTHEKYGIFFWYMMFGWWLILCYVLYIYIHIRDAGDTLGFTTNSGSRGRIPRWRDHEIPQIWWPAPRFVAFYIPVALTKSVFFSDKPVFDIIFVVPEKSWFATASSIMFDVSAINSRFIAFGNQPWPGTTTMASSMTFPAN